MNESPSPPSTWPIDSASALIHDYAKRLTLLIGTVAALAAGLRPASAKSPDAEEFRLFVQPLLAQRCLGCHSQAEASEKERFRADRLVVDAAGRVDPRFVVPGDAEASEIWLRVTSTDPELRMPPEGKGPPLSPGELARLKTWIEEGAPAESFWADVSPAEAVRNERRAVTASPSKEALDPVIDPLLEEAWRAAGIGPAAPASRETWLRRVTFALTGLPPTIEELDRFLADRAPGARERVVNRLFASPRFGERMAALWLDAARYADTHGYHADAHRDQWRWRDWAIDAFNRNLPYDRFILDQIAGDLATSDPGDPAPLGHPIDRRLATGFLRNHMINFEDGAFAEEYRVEYVADRVHTVAQAFLGTTLSCARCHDHPYDPISTDDYYSFYAFFDSIDEKGLDGERGNAVPIASAPTRLQREELAAIEEMLAQVESTLVEREPDFRVGQLAWERTALKKEGFVATPGDAALRLTFDEATLEDLTSSGRHSAKIEVADSPFLLPGKSGGELLLNGTSHVLCTFPNPIPFAGGLTVAGTFQLTSDDEATLWELSETEQEGSRARKQWRLVVAPGENELRVIAFEGETPVGQRTWKLQIERNAPTRIALRFEFEEADGHVDAFLAGKTLELMENAEAASSADEEAANDEAKLSTLDLDRLRASSFSALRFGGAESARGVAGIVDDGFLFARALSSEEIDALAGGNAIVDALSIDEAKRTEVQQKALADWYRRNVDPIASDLLRRRDEIAMELASLQAAIPDAMVAADLPQPRTTHVLLRGRYDSPGEVVRPRSLDFGSHSGDVARPDRLGLAENLVSPDHPRTSRVAVDRLWRIAFGQGLVPTPDDFGYRGEPPAHRRLLDRLAVEFVDSGWDVKATLRRIVLSRAFALSDDAGAKAHEADPDNRLFARFPSRRLEAEMTVDRLRFAAGTLHERIGGPSVFSYEPGDRWKDLSYSPGDLTAQLFRRGKGEDLYRRALYTFWKRASPPVTPSLFDVSPRETCLLARGETRTPLQALATLNDPVALDAYRELGLRLADDVTSDDRERLIELFRLATSRAPSPTEVAALETELAGLRTALASNPADVEATLAGGFSPMPAEERTVERAAWSLMVTLTMSLPEALEY